MLAYGQRLFSDNDWGPWTGARPVPREFLVERTLHAPNESLPSENRGERYSPSLTRPQVRADRRQYTRMSHMARKEDDQGRTFATEAVGGTLRYDRATYG